MWISGMEGESVGWVAAIMRLTRAGSSCSMQSPERNGQRRQPRRRDRVRSFVSLTGRNPALLVGSCPLDLIGGNGGGGGGVGGVGGTDLIRSKSTPPVMTRKPAPAVGPPNPRPLPVRPTIRFSVDALAAGTEPRLALGPDSLARYASCALLKHGFSSLFLPSSPSTPPPLLPPLLPLLPLLPPSSPPPPSPPPSSPPTSPPFSPPAPLFSLLHLPSSLFPLPSLPHPSPPAAHRSASLPPTPSPSCGLQSAPSEPCPCHDMTAPTTLLTTHRSGVPF